MEGEAVWAKATEVDAVWAKPTEVTTPSASTMPSDRAFDFIFIPRLFAVGESSMDEEAVVSWILEDRRTGKTFGYRFDHAPILKVIGT